MLQLVAVAVTMPAAKRHASDGAMGATVSHRTWHTPSEETDLDSGLSMPHVPMHVHLVDDDVDADAMSSHDGTETRHPQNLDGDRGSIALLMLLYVLQGIPLGLAGSIPYLLQVGRSQGAYITCCR